jgi:hypothetical protein
MSEDQTTFRDRLEDILESIELIQEWTVGRTTVDDLSSYTLACYLWTTQYHIS